MVEKKNKQKKSIIALTVVAILVAIIIFQGSNLKNIIFVEKTPNGTAIGKIVFEPVSGGGGGGVSAAVEVEVDPIWNANASNFTAIWGYAINDSRWTLNYSDYLVIKDYALNDSRWSLNYSTYLTKPAWSEVTNGTLLKYSDALNNTLMQQANWNATNTSYASWANVINGTMLSYLQALNGTLVLNSSLADYLKIANWNATNTSYLLGTNVTYAYSLNDTLWTANYSNFSVVYGYTQNQSDTDTFVANYSNFSRIYANVTDYNSSWSSTTNTSYLLGTNVTYSYSLNNTLWTLNYSNFSTIYSNQFNNYTNVNFNQSNFSVVYGYALNATGISWATANNGTLLNYSSALNGTLALNSSLADYVKTANWNATNTSYLLTTNITYAYSINDSLWTLNYSNFSVIYGYAINDSLWTLNYSAYLNKPTYAQVTNNTDIALVTSANTFGNFNQTFNGTTLFLWALKNWVGIGTTSPQQELNIMGDVNATKSIFSQNKNLSVGYDYALNCTLCTGISWATANNGTLLNYSNALNGSVEVNWNANATNFTVIYGYALNDSRWTLNYSDYLVIKDYALNDSTWTLNYSNYLLKPTLEY